MPNMHSAPFLLDANVFIEAFRRYYSFDICPGFWACVAHHNGHGRVLSIDRVHDEILAGDELSEWLEDISPSLFVSSATAPVARAFAEAMEWVQANRQFTNAAKADFASKADGWLIAVARVHGYRLVTHESPAPDARTRVPMPSVCQHLDVPWCDSFAMLRGLDAKFYWNQQRRDAALRAR